MKLFRILFFIVIISVASFCSAIPANAQRSVSYYRNRVPPKAIFVRLRSEEKRKTLLERNNQQKDVEILAKDVMAVNQVMVNDFSDNITVCPVYFFYEKDAGKLQHGDLAGIILDSLKNPVDPSVLAGIDTNFLVVYYGQPIVEADENSKYKNERGADRTSTIAVYEGLVILNNRFHNMPKPFDFFIGHSHVLRWLSFYRTNKKYNFASARFYIDYIASAKDLNENIKTFYDLDN